MSERLAGECCEVLKLVLSREPANGLGLVVGSAFTMSTGEMRDALCVKFRKAKKTESQQFAASTFAWVRFCPLLRHPDLVGVLSWDRSRGRQNNACKGDSR